MPVLYILAGPNGAGKSTFYYNAVNDKLIDPALPFINADIIVKNELGSYTAENYLKADEIVRFRIKNYVEHSKDFMIESNLATDAEYRWIENLQKAKGYLVILYFLYTDDVLINIERVAERVAEGGHSVPEAIIRHRYQLGFSYLKTHLHLFEEAYLFDNSQQTAVLLAIVKQKIIKFKADNFTPWITELLYLTKKLGERN